MEPENPPLHWSPHLTICVYEIGLESWRKPGVLMVGVYEGDRHRRYELGEEWGQGCPVTAYWGGEAKFLGLRRAQEEGFLDLELGLVDYGAVARCASPDGVLEHWDGQGERGNWVERV
ncbi:hypothetical protein Salat_0184400 [Sesamum alatum]|uniref:Uncharacterized protein n=1 Tax=Sesamum alatum TaxID=300844 RepID=A0AAE2CXQ6_9LAMI|nr:hypothetical protein Salat_0184400 [Sesamum alatum]